MADEREEQRISSWGELFMRTMELGLGAAALTAETAQRVVSDLVGRGQVKQEESASMVDRLMAMGREQREMLTNTVNRAVERTLERMDLARRSDVDALSQRVADLELAIMGYTTPPTTQPAGESTAADIE